MAFEFQLIGRSGLSNGEMFDTITVFQIPSQNGQIDGNISVYVILKLIAFVLGIAFPGAYNSLGRVYMHIITFLWYTLQKDHGIVCIH